MDEKPGLVYLIRNRLFGGNSEAEVAAMICLILVGHVPSQSNPELVIEIKAGLGLGIRRRKVASFVLAEDGYEFFNSFKGVRKVLRNQPADYIKAQLFGVMGWQ